MRPEELEDARRFLNEQGVSLQAAAYALHRAQGNLFTRHLILRTHQSARHDLLLELAQAYDAPNREALARVRDEAATECERVNAHLSRDSRTENLTARLVSG